MSQLRVDFEKWAALECQVSEFEKNEDGTYVNDNVQSMWIGYQGGRCDNPDTKPVMKFSCDPHGYHIEWSTLDFGTHLLYEHPPKRED